MRRPIVLTGALLAALAVAAIADSGVVSADPNALWKIVHYLCVPDQERRGEPAPCTRVDLDHGVERGYVVLKDIRGTTQYLLLPTARISGIESPAILAPDATNYLAAAWQARSFVEAAAHRKLPRDDLSLAINSVPGRSQNQLHIHIDCIRAGIRDALRREVATIGSDWAPLPVPLHGRRYRALRLDRAELGTFNPLVSLAADVARRNRNMALETLVVAGITESNGRPGFVFLAHSANFARGDLGTGEELQDHTCAVADAWPRQ